MFSVTGEVVPDKTSTRNPVATIESVEFLLWRLLFDLVISVTCEVLSDSTLKETPIDTTESVALYLSHLLN